MTGAADDNALHPLLEATRHRISLTEPLGLRVPFDEGLRITMNTRSISRIFTLGLSAAALAACGDDGNNTSTVATDGATTEEGTTEGPSTTPTTTNNNTQISVSDATTAEPDRKSVV